MYYVFEFIKVICAYINYVLGFYEKYFAIYTTYYLEIVNAVLYDNIST